MLATASNITRVIMIALVLLVVRMDLAFRGNRTISALSTVIAPMTNLDEYKQVKPRYMKDLE